MKVNYVDKEHKLQGYKGLAIAIVKQATNDYIYGHITENQFRNFCFSQWFELLTDIDGKTFYYDVKWRVKYNEESGKSTRGKTN